MQRWICFHRDVSKEDCDFALCSFNHHLPISLCYYPQHHTKQYQKHLTTACAAGIIYGKVGLYRKFSYIYICKCHHRIPQNVILERDSQGSWSPTPAWDNPENHTTMFVQQITTPHVCTGLKCTNICHSLPWGQGASCKASLPQLTETPVLTAKRVCTTWLTWHKSPMMFQASSTNWFNKSQPRKFFLHVTVKTARTFCESAHTHGAV